MALGVVILNWNAAQDTLACLDSIQSWENIAARIWVVDNASADGSAEQIAQAHPGVRLIRCDSNLGFAGGNNAALRQVLETNRDAVMLLNNDALIDQDSVAALLETLQAHPEIGIVGPTLWDSEHPDVLLSAGGADMARNVVSHIRRPLPAGQIRTVDYVPGTCVVIRAQVLGQVGLLDEAYFFGGEVADLCARARQQGFSSAIAGRARAVHCVSRSSEMRHTLHAYYVLRNRFLFIRKFHRQEMWPLFAMWSGYGIYLCASALAHRQRQRARSILLGLADGLRGRFGGQNERVLKTR